MPREYEAGPVIHVRGGRPVRDPYDCSMNEYRAARVWWNAATKDERHTTTIDPLEWEFLSSIEHWSLTAQLINTGYIQRDWHQEAYLKKVRAAVNKEQRSSK